jgi:hypothetical protein
MRDVSAQNRHRSGTVPSSGTCVTRQNRQDMAVLALAAAFALPVHGILAVGKSLGDVRLGMTPAQVEHAWGTTHAHCRNCRRTTWYFNYRKFRPQGAAVEFARGRVAAVWTLWRPRGWRTRDGGLSLGENALEVNARFGALVSIPCGSYRAMILTRHDVTTWFYVYGDELWGFGLGRPAASPCR